MRFGRPWDNSRLGRWRPWFAWRPVLCQDGWWRWLEVVERCWVVEEQADVWCLVKVVVPRYRKKEKRVGLG